MTSRLDRLFILLESGSSAVTRRAAAKQIGEVQKLHPHELHNLLNRLSVYMQSHSWDTRVAASQAVQAILENVPQWKVAENVSIKKENEETKTPSAKLETRFSFDKFNLQIILENSKKLMGSQGNEFDLAAENEEVDSNERLMTQRAILNEKLGFSVAKKLGMNLDDMVTLEDMQPSTPKIEKPGKLDVQDIINKQASSSQQTLESSMSSREINRAKRKARQIQAGSSISRTNSIKEEPERKKIKTEPSESSFDSADPVPDGTGVWIDAVEWPLETFCNKLYADLFSPRWETRHGSATALRELMKTHISGGGISALMTAEEQKEAHFSFLEDAALRVLCVLALDRFGDFVTDQVVAPVRETCAQVLGTILKEMPNEMIKKTVEILQSFIKQKDWEVRHAGVMGLKYFLVVREDLIPIYLPIIIKDILDSLLDSVDDVSSVAASALIPIASHLPKLLSKDQVSAIVKMLWNLLLDQDELAAACNNFMGLLAAILSLPNASNWIEMERMEILVPRLWPFLSHQSSSVRRSTLQTLRKLTEKRENLPTTSASTNGSETLRLNFGVQFWPALLLQEALRHVFQRVLVEHVEDIQSLVVEVWNNIVRNSDLAVLLPAVCPLVSCWMCLTMQPAKLAFDPSLMIHATSKASRLVGDTSAMPNQKWFLGGAETISQDVREKNVIRARYKACKMLGLLSQFLVLPAPNVVYKTAGESPIDCYAKLLLGYLNSRSSLQRTVTAMIITFWAENDPTIVAPDILQERLRASLSEYLYFDEISTMVTRLLQEASDFVLSLKQYNVILGPPFDAQQMLTLDQIKELSTTATDNLKARFQLKTKVASLLEDRRKSLFNSYSSTSVEQSQLSISTQSSLACAVSRLRCLPEKLNPVVKPLMESIKREENEILQKMSAESLTFLLSQTGAREPSPNAKIVTNLSTLLRSDEEFTPPLGLISLNFKDFKPNGQLNPYYGIVTLQKQMSSRGVQPGSSSGAGSSRGPGRPSAMDMSLDESNDVDDPSRKAARNQRIGSTFAIQSSCEYFAESLPIALPTLWQLMFDVLVTIEGTEFKIDEEHSIKLVTSLQLLEVASPYLHKNLHHKLFEALPKLCLLIQHPLNAIRHLTSRCLATLASIDSNRVMLHVINELVPLLSQIESPINREGAIEAITWVVNKLQFQIVPYVILLIVPILGRMSDQNEHVRLMSSNCFATLIQLMPLDALTPELEQDLPGNLKNRKLKDKEFLNYLFCPKTIPDFKVPVPISAELRSYQQAGINWLWFLNKFSLCGILCDDMGLGKTLQTICILAGDHHQRAIEKQAQLPSLVVCPPTLVGHWAYEVQKFVSEKYLSPLQYFGLPAIREELRNQIKYHNLVIASYDIVRKDIEFFSKLRWNYCILDEGHIIKNGKTKCSKAIKQLHANHRLILSGTPIQNNVLELHSLFDFLMPGFLGSEKQFQVRFSRPILASRDPKSSPKEQEAGALAMESLHRQVLPFLLRRVKEEVLTDLPAKITQDLLCELSPLQERLYEDFSNSQSNLRECLESLSTTDVVNKNKTHVFQALRYLQNVCNHPKLVLKPHHPEYQNILSDLRSHNTTLDDIEHSAKLPALKQLLLDCGIGTNDDMSVNQHRALVFCQLKAMIDIIENDLLKKHMPGVSYLRLDGSVPANMRHEIVHRFNSDPSQDILLLTTQVGGLGLNLTGADTVIFVEHDYNPMKDLQAMDRAHRIGQKRVVNVYRLITRKSLEEKIMGLQKFKIQTAHTVVQNNNKDMKTMGTDQLLDLFNLSKHDGDGRKKQSDGNGTSMKSMLENLPELWDDQQYAEEFDMTQFIEGLKK